MKKIIAILVALVLVFSIMTVVYAEEPEKTELVYWYWADDTAANELIQQIIADYNATNTLGVTVIGEEQPWDNGGYTNTLLTACLGGGGPDVAMFRLNGTKNFVENEMLVDLDEMLGKWDGYSDINESVWQQMRNSGDGENCYVMPWTMQILYVYYRPSYFEMAGVKVPETYEELLDAIKACTMDTDGDGQTDIYGFSFRGAANGHEPWGSFLYGRGGSWEHLDSAGGVAAMQDIIDLYKGGYFPPSAPNDGYSEILANFQSGLAAMTIHHTSSSAAMVQALGDDVAAFPFPQGEDRWTATGYCNNVVLSNCKNKEAGFDFLTYLVSADAAEKWSLQTFNIPVSTSVQNIDAIASNRFMAVSAASVDFAGMVPITPTSTEFIAHIWPETMQKAMLGLCSAEEAMAEMQEGLNG